MVTATVERKRARTSGEPEQPTVGEDGSPVAYRGGVAYSLKPYPEDERPLFWNPIYPGQEMRWKAEEINEYGLFPTIQKEIWLEGKFRPRNDYEAHMTREWMKASLPGCNDPDEWQGVNHPEGPGHQWRCECSWPCGNWKAFQAHRRYLRHRESLSE